MKLAGALHLCHREDPQTKRATLAQEGYQFIVRQKPSDLSWDTGCILSIRRVRVVDEDEQRREYVEEDQRERPSLVHEVFSQTADCLFYLESVYGIPDGQWWPLPGTTFAEGRRIHGTL